MRQRMIVRGLSIASIALVLTGCGYGSPSSPSPAPSIQVAGTWSGALDSANFPQQSITLTLTQTGTSIGGTWSVAAQAWSGAVSGTLSDSTFSGNFTLTTPGATGGTCSGTGTMGGSITATTMTWTGPGFTGACGGMPLTVRITAQKR